MADETKKLTDARDTRRFRNILANSGELMEDGEQRDLDVLYVMGDGGELFQIAALATDPDAQTERYSVKAQADHGSIDPLSGMTTPTIEKQFGSCKVWLEDDGLHARMYFADNDELADHAWAISADASYSTGIDWYPNGYHGVGYDLDGNIGILREVSMVLTGNDPRAVTIDSSKRKARMNDKEEFVGGCRIKQRKGNYNMSKKKKTDALTAEERDRLIEVINSLTAEENSAEKSSTTKTAVAAAKKDTKKVSPALVVVKDTKTASQEHVISSKDNGKDWLTSKDGHRAFVDTLKSHGRFGGAFDIAWRDVLRKHMSLDGIEDLPTPAAVDSIFVNALSKSSGIISRFSSVNTRSLRVHTIYTDSSDESLENARAKGHTKGQTKAFQELSSVYRDVLVRMIYKKLDIDAIELYENPELIDFRAQELVEAYIREIERGAIIGDGRSAGDTTDYRIFDGTRGLFAIKEDIGASGIGNYLASSVEAGDNLYASIVAAKGKIKTEGRQYIVAKSSVITALRLATVSENSGQYLIAPGSSVEEILDVDYVYTPSWMDEDDTNDAYLIVDGAYTLIGEPNPNSRPFFDTTNNTDVLLVEGAKGGSLTKYHSAVAIKTATTTEE